MLVNKQLKHQYLSNKNSVKEWGVKEYKVPVKNFDFQKHKQEKDNYLMSIGKIKKNLGKVNKEAIRGSIFDIIQKKSKSVPPPWKYNHANSWINSNNAPSAGYLLGSKNQQAIKFAWKEVSKEDQKILNKPVFKKTKPNLSVSKNTFLEHLINSNNNKNFPKPGPGYYFLDSKTAKNMFPNNSFLIETKTNDNISKDTFSLVKKKRIQGYLF